MQKVLIILLGVFGLVIIVLGLRTYKFNFTNSDNISESKTRIDSGVEGIVTIGPTCPVERVPPDPKCADRPYATSIQVISAGSPRNSPFTTGKSDKEGKYKIILPPGDYMLQPMGAAMLRCAAKNITIEPFKMIKVNLSCDSGIR